MENYVVLFFVIFIINIIPAFMPSTWIVLSFLYIHHHLLFFPTLIIGTVAATLGRVILALMSQSGIVQRLLPKNFLSNYEDLGNYLKQNHKITIPVIFGYAISPIPSNILFIMVGLAKLNLKVVAIAFACGRFISYAFWMTTTHQFANQLSDIFKGGVLNPSAVLNALISIIIIIAMGKINWGKIFMKLEPKFKKGTSKV